MDELNNKLGKKLTAQEVAEYFGVDAETVRRYYHLIGGIRLGRRFLFFENLIIHAIEETSHALQAKEEEQDRVDSRCDETGQEVLQDIRYQGKSPCMGIGNKKHTRKRIDDPFGILDAH
jgi:DNA-directed RNA polymerase specialized sigma subunit